MTKEKYMVCNSAEDDSTIYMELDENEAKLLEEVFGRLNDAKNKYAPTITICPFTPRPATGKIWTITYRPFIMGGDTNQAISTIVPIVEKKTICGFDFFSFNNPRGGVRICEAQTGGIVASSFEEIENNIKGVSTKVLQGQIDDQFPIAFSAQELSNEEFFGMYIN